MTGALSILKAAAPHLLRILAWGAPPALVLAACDDDTGPTPTDGGPDGRRPDTLLCPEGGKLFVNIHIEGLRYGAPFLTNMAQTPAGPIDVFMKVELDRNQIPYDEEGTFIAISRFTSIPPFYDHESRDLACSKPPENNNYCDRSEGTKTAHVRGGNLNQLIFFVVELSTPDNLVGTSWGAIFEGLGLLTHPETEEMGTVLYTVASISRNQEDPSKLDLSLDFETVVEDPNNPGRYLRAKEPRLYVEGYLRENGGLPTAGVPTSVKGLNIISWEDGHGAILQRGVRFLFAGLQPGDIASGKKRPSTTGCEGTDCQPIEGITLTRVWSELECKVKQN